MAQYRLGTIQVKYRGKEQVRYSGIYSTGSVAYTVQVQWNSKEQVRYSGIYSTGTVAYTVQVQWHSIEQVGFSVTVQIKVQYNGTIHVKYRSTVQ